MRAWNAQVIMTFIHIMYLYVSSFPFGRLESIPEAVGQFQTQYKVIVLPAGSGKNIMALMAHRGCRKNSWTDNDLYQIAKSGSKGQVCLLNRTLAIATKY